MKMFLSFVNLD